MTIIRTTRLLKKREPHDFYETPYALCDEALRLQDAKSFQTILDAGAGTGHWGYAARQIWPSAHLIGMESNPQQKNSGWYNDWYPVDYLNFVIGQVPDFIIGNPPFKLAEEFIWQAHNQLEYGGKLMFLLRLSFLESVTRGRGLWHDWPPKEIHVLSQRVSWTKNGKTDDTAYAIYTWHRFKQNSDARRVHPRLGWLDWRP